MPREKAEAPWKFSDEYSEPGQPPRLVPNEPCADGWAAGAHLARFAEQAIGNGPDRRCEDCAFRKGTDPNGCVSTVMDALKCVMERTPFLCHHEDAAGNLPPCAGWVAMVHAPEEAAERARE
jgi:hypothetical protein